MDYSGLKYTISLPSLTNVDHRLAEANGKVVTLVDPLPDGLWVSDYLVPSAFNGDGTRTGPDDDYVFGGYLVVDPIEDGDFTP